jgi:hypothetical protein
MNKQIKELQYTLNTLHDFTYVDLPIHLIQEYITGYTYYLGQIVKAEDKVYLFYTLEENYSAWVDTPEYLKPHWKEIKYKQLGETS